MKEHFEFLHATLDGIADSFPESPFRQKVDQVKSLYDRKLAHAHPLYRAAQITRMYWIDRLREDPMPLLDFLIGRVHEPQYFIQFCETAIAFLWQTRRNALLFSHICVIAAAIFPACNHVPVWHTLVIWRDTLLRAICRIADLGAFLFAACAGLPPTDFVGAVFVLVKGFFVSGEDLPKVLKRLPHLIRDIAARLCLSEHPQITRLLHDLIADCPCWTGDSVELCLELLVESADKGWRYFVRLAAPMLQVPVFREHANTHERSQQILDSVLRLLEGPDAEELAASKSLVLLWGSLDCWTGHEGKLAQLIDLSAARIEESRHQKPFFWRALAHLAKIHPKEFVESLRQDLAVGVRNYLQQVQEETADWVTWPIDDWVPEVTGFAYHQDNGY
jgi:hypothetical protein